MAVARARARSFVGPRRWVVVGILAFTLAAPAGALAAAGPRARASVATISPADRAATHMFLEAEYKLVKAALASTLVVEAAEAGAAETLDQECKGVLGEPRMNP
jgi:hypothetical protein